MPNERIVGLVRSVARLSEKTQREYLENACGRIWGYDQFPQFMRYIRQGDLVVVCAPHVLGHSRDAIEANITAILNKRCSIRVQYEGSEALEAHHTGKDAIVIALKAVAGLSNNERGMTSEEASAAGSTSWTRKKKKEGRTPWPVARKRWFSPAAQKLTVKERLKHKDFKGWTDKTIYRRLAEEREN